MSTTIDDVAKKAGVSITTVSRVINHNPRVDKDTRKKVEDVMQELKYVPNLMARGLMLNRTNTVGVFLPDITGEFFSELIRGVDDIASQNKFHILLNRIRRIHEELGQVSRLIQEGRVDGLILMSPSLTENEIINMVGNKFPVVVLDRKFDLQKIYSIQVDNVYGAMEITRHLVEFHHYNRLAFIGGPMDEPDTGERFKGFNTVLNENNIPLRNEYVREGNFTIRSGYEKTGELINLSEKPEVIFCANDEMAKGAIDAILEKGFKVPEDIAVVGFDDVNFASHIRPSLTTVKQPIYQMGVLAMEKFMDSLTNPNQEKSNILLPTQLVLRESCGCKQKD